MTATIDNSKEIHDRLMKLHVNGLWYLMREASPLRGLSVGKAMRLVWEIILTSELELAELQGSMIAIATGIWLCMPWFHNPENNFTIFQPLMHIVPHEFWAAMFMAVGLGQLFGLLSGHYAVRRGFCLTSIALWGFVAGLLSCGEWRALAFPYLVLFFGGALLGYIKMGFRHDRRYKNNAKYTQ